MIQYEHGKWGVFFTLSLKGSIFPKALMWAFPAAAVSALMNIVKQYNNKEVTDSPGTVLTSFASFITIMGFMVVFRSNQAWGRFWEGAALVQQVRGSWFNSASSLFAFTTSKPEKAEEVAAFKRSIVRLMSLLFGCALGSLKRDATFRVLSQEGIDEGLINFVDTISPRPEMDLKCEVILQWIQRSVIKNMESGNLCVAPPIMTRVFQELSQGIVNIASARKINELPFPFPYAQMMSVMLIAYTVGVPCAAGYVMETWWGAAGSTFANVFVLWGVNYLAADIEMPFGDGPNHLPLAMEMERMNCLLKMLLHPEAGVVPSYVEQHSSEFEDEKLIGAPIMNWRSVKRLSARNSGVISGLPPPATKPPPSAKQAKENKKEDASLAAQAKVKEAAPAIAVVEASPREPPPRPQATRGAFSKVAPAPPQEPATEMVLQDGKELRFTAHFTVGTGQNANPGITVDRAGWQSSKKNRHMLRDDSSSEEEVDTRPRSRQWQEKEKEKHTHSSPRPMTVSDSNPSPPPTSRSRTRGDDRSPDAAAGRRAEPFAPEVPAPRGASPRPSPGDAPRPPAPQRRVGPGLAPQGPRLVVGESLL